MQRRLAGYCVNPSDNGRQGWIRAKSLSGYASGTDVTLDVLIDNSAAYYGAIGVANTVGTVRTNSALIAPHLGGDQSPTRGMRP